MAANGKEFFFKSKRLWQKEKFIWSTRFIHADVSSKINLSQVFWVILEKEEVN